jgi:hypothetical protein
MLRSAWASDNSPARGQEEGHERTRILPDAHGAAVFPEHGACACSAAREAQRQTRPEIAARWKRALEKIAEDKVAWNLVTIAREALDGGPAERGSGVYVSEAQWEAYEAGRARGTYEAERAHAVLYDPALGTRPEDRAYAAGLAAGCTEVATLKARIVELEAQVEKERKSR